MDNETISYPEEDSLFFYATSKSYAASHCKDSLAEHLQVNVLNCRRPFIPFEEFYNEPLSDAIEMDNDYLYYKNRQGCLSHLIMP